MKRSASYALVLLLNVCLINCMPTSLLVNTKEAANAKKVKRAPPTESDSMGESIQHQTQQQLSLSEDGKSKHKMTQQKRGVNQKLLDEIQLANQLQASSPWDESLYLPYDTSDLVDVFGGRYAEPLETRPYEKPSRFLDADQTLPTRFFNERKKRSSLAKWKRESKLSPTEILTLLSLVEQAQRHGKVDSDDVIPASFYQSPNAYQVQSDDEGEWLNNPLSEPSIEYYPLSAPSSLYDYSPWYQPNPMAKRFMVSKRSSGQRALGKSPDKHFF